MTTKDLLSLVKERGLSVELRPDGTPVLKCGNNPAMKTDALLKVLRLHRERIIEMLSKK